MTVIVHSKSLSACMQCTMTERELAKTDAVVTVVKGIDTPEMSETLAAFKARGLSGAPIVVVLDDEGVEVASWAGFRPDLIGKHAMPAAA